MTVNDVHKTDTSGLAAALAELQTQLPKVAKSEKANTGTYSYTYAGLASLSDKLLPLLGKLGLSFTCRPTLNNNSQFVLAYRLWHTSGEYLEGEYPLPATGTPQAIGSAITYGRRYSLCAITGVAPEDDDDGAAAEAQASAHRAAQPRPRIQRPSAYSPEGTRPAGDDTTIEGDRSILARLHIRLKDKGIGGEEHKAKALAYYAKTIGREVQSSKQLTHAEAEKVIARLTAELKQGVDVPADPAEPDPTLDPDWEQQP